MNSIVLITYYCLLILGASIVGGMIPVWFRLTHRVMECAVSFVAGVMLGVGLLHMLPHALQQSRAAASPPATDLTVMVWVLAGLLTMFFIERFFCFHHHEVEDGEITCHHDHDAAGHHMHGHDVTGIGAAIGLTLHSIIAGVALAASVQHGHATMRLAGLGTFLVILLHKPFDSMTIATLMARGGWSLWWRHLVNSLFSLAIPLGVLIFHVGIDDGAVGEGSTTLGYALAFASGTFLCIALSDLLPELQFHDHDRGKLSLALLLGLALAYGVCKLEGISHTHSPALNNDIAPPAEAASPTARVEVLVAEALALKRIQNSTLAASRSLLPTNQEFASRASGNRDRRAEWTENRGVRRVGS